MLRRGRLGHEQVVGGQHRGQRRRALVCGDTSSPVIPSSTADEPVAGVEARRAARAGWTRARTDRRAPTRARARLAELLPVTMSNVRIVTFSPPSAVTQHQVGLAVRRVHREDAALQRARRASSSFPVAGSSAASSPSIIARRRPSCQSGGRARRASARPSFQLDASRSRCRSRGARRPCGRGTSRRPPWAPSLGNDERDVLAGVGGFSVHPALSPIVPSGTGGASSSSRKGSPFIRSSTVLRHVERPRARRAASPCRTVP